MAALLDRLTERLWLPWLACIGFGVAGVVLDETGHQDFGLISNLAAPVGMIMIILDYLRWHAIAREALGAAKLKNVGFPREWNLLALMLLSFLSMTAVYAFAFPHDLIMPLFASMMIPMFLRSRGALIARLSAPQFAG